MQYKDYYQILGVPREANQEDIKRSYRKLARKFHPDVSKEANAEERFKDVQEAYEVLKDPKKREAYNQLGSQWKAGQEFHPPPDGNGFGGVHFEDIEAGDFSDFFSSLFGGIPGSRARHHASMRQRGRDQHVKLAIALEEAYHGGAKTIQLQLPNHQMRTLKINIPKGVVNGQQLRLSHQGLPGLGNAPAGDLYIEIQLLPHRLFTLQERDVYLTLPVTPWEAVLGAKITVPTLGGSVEMKIAPNSQAGQKLRLKERGLPGKPPGDQYVLLQIVVPPAKTAAERALYEQCQSMMPFDPRKAL